MTIEQYLVPLLTFLAVMGIGAGILLLRSLKVQSVRSRLGAATDLEQGGPGESHGPLHRLAAGLGRASGGGSKDLRTLMAQAGYQGDKAATVFLGVKVLLFVTGLGLCALLTYPLSWPFAAKITIILAGAAFGMFLPNIVVR